MKQTVLFKISLFAGCLLLFSSALFANKLETAEQDTTDIYKKIMMDRVTVVGQPIWQTNIPGAASYVSAEQLQRQKYTDISRILRSVSGVNIQDEDGFGLRPNIGLRGAGSERSSKISIMEDGVLIAPAPYSAPAAYYFPNVARINSIEVRKGSSQIKHGPNTTGGALNLRSTPIPAVFSGRAEMSLGERNSNKLYANIGDRFERFGYLLEATQLGDDGFKELDGNGDTGFIVRDLLGKFMIQSSSDSDIYQRLELKATYHTESSDETYLGLSRSDFESNPFRRYAGSQVDEMNTEHTQIMARHSVMFSDNFDMTTTIYRNDFSRSWYKLHDLNTNVDGVNTGNLFNILADPAAHSAEYALLTGSTSPDDALTVRDNNREYYAMGIESILGFNFDIGNVQNDLELGIRLHQDEEDRFQFEDDYSMQDGQMVLTTAGIAGQQANRVGSATALSVYLQDNIETDRFTFTPGIRFESIWFNNRNYGSGDIERTGSNLEESDFTVNILLPGIGVTYQATESLSLITGVHRGFSPPNPSSPGETRPEESVNYELGFRYDRPQFQAEVIGFYNNYSNLLGNDLASAGGAGTGEQFNAGEVDVVGLELTLNSDLSALFDTGNAALPLNVNYTFTDATFQSSFASGFSPWGEVQKGDNIPFIPTHQFNASLSFDLEQLSAGINTSYQPKMRTVAGSGSIPADRSTDSVFLVDFQSSYNLTGNLNLFLNIRNLFNEEYIVSDRPRGLRPGLPRTFSAGMNIEF